MTARTSSATMAPVAIIGLACKFACAPDARTYWNNILDKVDAIGEPLPAWGAQRYLDAGRIKTQAGGFLRELYRFDPREFGIMPNSLDGGEPDQFLALQVARDALVDAGYAGPGVDHSHTGVILGHSTYLHRGQVTVVQTDIVIDQTMELIQAALPDVDAAALGELRALLKRKVPPMNPDTAPGLVPNVMTGRIANRLDLRGPNYLIDAACSSSLLAVGAAIDELRAGRSRMMLAGGVNASLPADVTTIFTQLGALSGRGRVRPFEAESDGTLLGEGLGVVVLKRLDDALADGDRVYAVLRGVGQSSDGRVTGLLAPSQQGETLAMRRAYEAAEVDPDSITLVEAHGTGIPLGDRTEVAALKAVFGERRTAIAVKALGSVKSMISHCIPAAGVASLIKVALALHHRVLPPTLCAQVNPELGVEGTPFYVNTETAPWISRIGQPRRAGVNAFGFGGTNSHAIVEQAPDSAVRPMRMTRWPAELCVLSADSAQGLATELEALAAALARNPQWQLAEVAAALARRDAGLPHRMSLVVRDTAALAKGIQTALARLREGRGSDRWSARGGLAYGSRRLDGKLAFLFPGEGSQYPGMYADLALVFDPIQRWLEFWHGLYGLPQGQTRTDIVFPSSDIGAEQRRALEQRMHDMDVGSESVFIGGMAMHELLSSMGVEPDVMLGHSSGESAALGASGANPATTAEERTECIRKHFAVYERLLADGKIPTGALLAVGALPPDDVQAQIDAVPGVTIAMDNCANQIVLYGSPEGIAQVQQRLTAEGGICLPLPFDRGYHTADFAEASKAFLDYYKDVRVGRPKVPMYSCASAGLFPDQPAAVRKLAAAQWSTKVRFRETVLQMHADGVRAFVEVGPSSKLTAFVNDILIDRDFTALATNVRRKNGVEQLLTVFGQLYVLGRGPRLDRLFEGRAIGGIDLAGTAPPPRGMVLDNSMPYVALDSDERSKVRQWLGSPLVEPARATPDAARSPAASAAPVAPESIAPPHDTPDPRAAVMADYFDVMRGFLERQSELVSRWREHDDADPQVPAAQGSPGVVSSTPLLGEIVAQHDGQLRARSRFTLSFGFIRDHVMSGPVSASDPTLFGLSCVPFAASVEAMAEACTLLAGRSDVTVIEDVKAFDWLALDDGEVSMDIVAEAIDAAAGRYRARVEGPRGTVLSAEFGFGTAWRLPAVAPLAEPRESWLNHPHLYATGMFHGPIFQSMTWVEGWSDSGIDVRLSRLSLLDFIEPGQEPALVLNPVLLDAMGQVVACWLVQYVGTQFHAFPSTIRRLELFETCPREREGVVLRMRQQAVDPAQDHIDAARAWCFDCVDAEGRTLMRGQDLVNLFFRVPTAYHEVRVDPLRGWFGAQSDHPAPGHLLLWELPMLSEEFCAQSGAIGLRILAHAILAPAERLEWLSLPAQTRRRREWLFGRAALKEAVRAWHFEGTGELLYPSDIVVDHDERGAPRVSSDHFGPGGEPQVSLSHAAGRCLAAVSSPGAAVGVDLEQVGRVRDPALLVESLAQAERAWVQGLAGVDLEDRLLRLWCAKESAAKCLGLGLQGRPERFVVVTADDSFERLVVRHSDDLVDVEVCRLADSVSAVAQAATTLVDPQ